MCRLTSVVLVVLCCCQVAWSGPKGDVTVRGVAPGSITIDGDFSDWPLSTYTQVAQQPLFPDAQDMAEVNIAGDHIVYDIDRVGLFNGTDEFELFDEGLQDFGSTILFAHDGKFLYVLASTIDDVARGDLDATEFGDQGFLNDGFEIFLDAENDSDDNVAGNSFPAFDEEDPNFDDLQITFALNDNFLSDDAAANALGARQHMERAGSIELMGEIRNAPDQEDSYRFFLDAAEADDGNPDIAALAYDDLRAAGAPNPEIADNEGEDFAGYVIEARIPFGIIDGFEPDENMGIGLFWRDLDGEGSVRSWMDWTQNTEVPCNEDESTGLFCGFNWGELIFDELPQTDPLDCNGDGSLTADDLACANASGILADLQAELGIIDGDLDGNGSVEFADFLALSGSFGTATNDYTKGDIDGNGMVEFADFLVLSGNFGQSAVGAATVPEPDAGLLVWAGFMAICLVRRNR